MTLPLMLPLLPPPKSREQKAECLHAHEAPANHRSHLQIPSKRNTAGITTMYWNITHTEKRAN